MLELRFLECESAGPGASPDQGFSTAAVVAACDGKRDGLQWKPKTRRVSLTQVVPQSIEARGLQTELGVTFTERDDAYGIQVLECRDRTACERMADNLRQLAQLAAGSVAEEPTAAIQQQTGTPKQSIFDRPPPQGTSAQQVKTLIDRINSGFHGSYMLADDDPVLLKGEYAVLLDGFVLRLNSYFCDVEDVPGSEFSSAADLARVVAQCDANEWWIENSWDYPLAETQLISSTVPKDTQYDRLFPSVSLRYLGKVATSDGEPREQVAVDIGCNVSTNCVSMAVDVGALMNWADRYTAARRSKGD